MTSITVLRGFAATAGTVASSCAAIAIATLSAGSALADTSQARCDYYPRGEDRAEASMPCTFSQRQGFVTLRRQDGLTHEFRPRPNGTTGYLDSRGGPVAIETSDPAYTIYRTPRESIYVYWGNGAGSTAGRPSSGPNHSSPTPVTYLTEINRNRIRMQITEGEFRFRGILNRTSGNMFVGQDNQVRVMYDRDTKQVVVINRRTGTEFYNYIFSDVDEGAL